MLPWLQLWPFQRFRLYPCQPPSLESRCILDLSYGTGMYALNLPVKKVKQIIELNYPTSIHVIRIGLFFQFLILPTFLMFYGHLNCSLFTTAQICILVSFTILGLYGHSSTLHILLSRLLITLKFLRTRTSEKQGQRQKKKVPLKPLSVTTTMGHRGLGALKRRR